MNRESLRSTQAVPFPPARTSAADMESAAARGLMLLPPVLSGLLAPAVRTAAADAPPVDVGASPLYAPTAPPADDLDAPMADVFDAAIDDDETVEYELVAEEVTIDLSGYAEFDSGDDDTFVLDVEAGSFETHDEAASVVDSAFSGSDALGEEGEDPGVTWYGEDESSPWDEALEAPDAEIVLESETEPAHDLVIEGEEGFDAGPAEEAVPTDEKAERELRHTPPPISPWDLGPAATSPEATERAARAHAEWESLGQALSDSLDAAGPPVDAPGLRGYDLTDEKAAELDAEPTSPFGGPVLSVGSSGPGESESPVSDLVQRLEAFAANLREEGTSALNRAQAGDDRFNALLASIAAGFLAGRGE
ncbi:MAG TPA: hypothetical protein VMM79_15210 [Longimicrobiales bacterium]|nr:hypothetical protein [Longimicrobiales bacterium]